MIGGEILLGIFGNAAYDVVRRACGAVWPSEERDPAGELAARLTAAALNRAVSRFFERYGEAFGRPGVSFLARAENYERVMQAVYVRGASLEEMLFVREGFDGAPSATDDAIRAFALLVEEEMRAHLSLDRLLTDRANDRRLERIASVVERLEPAAHARLRPAAPAPPAGFVDRDDVRAEAERALRAGRHVALLGMGGVGKSAVATRVSADAMAAFPGGTLWGSLAAHQGEALPILRAWAASCGHPLDASAPPDRASAAVRAAISGFIGCHGAVLAILDDAREEWLDALTMVCEALPAGTPLLLTTRHDRLAVSIGAERCDVAPLTPEFSVALLDPRASSSAPPVERSELTTLAAEVGHLPLALVLLGKRIALATGKPGARVAQLLEEVRRRPLDAPYFAGEPQLRGVFFISYDALDASVRAVFRSAGAFARPVVELDAVAAVAGELAPAAESALDALVLSSMADWDTVPGRYVLHPLLHEYASACLDAAEGSDIVRARHASHFVAHAESQARIAGVDRTAAFAAMEEAFPEYERASEHLARRADGPAARALNALASALWQDSGFLLDRGEYARALPVLDRASVAAREAGMSTALSVHVGHLGLCLAHLGRLPEAIASVEEALAICRREGNAWDEAAHLANLGALRRAAGDLAHSIRTFEDALSAARRSNNIRVAQDVLGHLGGAYRHHDPGLAERYYCGSRELAEQLGDALGVAAAISNLGLLAFDTGDLAEAERLIRDALARAEALGDRRGIANRLGHLGNILVRRTRLTDAHEHFTRALALCREIGWWANEAPWLLGLGNIARLRGAAAEAREHYQQAARAAHAASDPLQTAFAWFNLAVLRVDGGDGRGARLLLRRALPALRDGAPEQAAYAEALLRDLGEP